MEDAFGLPTEMSPERRRSLLSAFDAAIPKILFPAGCFEIPLIYGTVGGRVVSQALYENELEEILKFYENIDIEEL